MNEEKKIIIPIVLAADHFYAMPLAVTITSMIANKKFGHIYKIYILDGGLNIDDKQKLKNFCSDEVLIEFLNIIKNDFKLFPEKRHLKIAAYYRLIVPKMIDYEKIIYLDSDIILNFDLIDLYKIDLRGRIIAAVREISEEYVKKYFFRPITKYFNTGVLLIDTKKWKDQKICERTFDFINNNINKIKYADQDALNHILEDDWLEIDSSFNFQLDKHQVMNADSRINVLHFVGPLKPWHYSYNNGYKQWFLKYLQASPYSNYKYPDKNIKTILQKFFLEPVFIFVKKIVKKIAPKFLMKLLKNIFWYFSNRRDSR